MKTKSKRPRWQPGREALSGRAAAPVAARRGAAARKPAVPAAAPPREEVFVGWRARGLVLFGLLAACAWANWPVLVELVQTWSREPDYSHGFFVVPLAGWMLWLRRESYPGLAPNFAWPALGLLGLSTAMRATAAVFYVDALDGWSLVLWVAGVVWLLGGVRLLGWAWPAVFFLLFAIPLPFRAEHLLSWQLQRVATSISTWVLQCLGQPALGEGNTIQLGEHRLEVEQACSGLRIFVGIAALSFFYVVVVRRAWWVRLLLLGAALPIALVANATRIVLTGLLYNLVSSEAAQTFSHDLAGYVMLPLAAALFALVLWYLGQLVYRSDGEPDAAPSG
ncbi:MAG: exosortase/archaeosortase family protein [Pirellulaceae bacterium]|nr:exosortase/archaeosortase family protein [Pirellulaceae bacterium]